jgi:hypothetical protein
VPAKASPNVPAWLAGALGCDVYGLASLFETAREEGLPPKGDRKLKAYLEEHLYVEGEMLFEPHAIQVLTDDDEIELAYYIFDDRYLRDNPEKAAYLLHEDWRLPTTSVIDPYQPNIKAKEIRPPGAGPGATYLAFLVFYDSGGLTDLEDFGGPCRVEGVRLPQLAQFLEATAPGESWPFELALLRSQMSAEDPAGIRLGAALRRVARLPVIRISEEGSRGLLRAATVEEARTRVEQAVKALKAVPDHDLSKCLVGASDHLAQLSLHVGDWFGRDVYHQWVVFDDLWAGRRRDLADGILRFAKRWDVLST